MPPGARQIKPGRKIRGSLTLPFPGRRRKSGTRRPTPGASRESAIDLAYFARHQISAGEVLSQRADIYAFLLNELGVEYKAIEER